MTQKREAAFVENAGPPPEPFCASGTTNRGPAVSRPSHGSDDKNVGVDTTPVSGPGDGINQAEPSQDDGAANGEPIDRADEAVAILRPRNTEPDPSDYMCVVAVNAQAYPEAELETSKHELIEHWCSCLDRMSRAEPDLCKLGVAISDHLRFGISAESAAELLGLEKADDEMRRALQAALLGAFATTLGPVDIDTAKHAVASFVHSHPLFAGVIKKDAWKPPFREHTTYRKASVAWLKDEKADTNDKPESE